MVKRIGDGFIIAGVLALLFGVISLAGVDTTGPASITGFSILQDTGQGQSVEYIQDQECYDSDNYNGMSSLKTQIYTAGHVSAFSATYKDVCGRDMFFNHVYEQVCEKADLDVDLIIPATKIVECPQGTTCIKGECV